MGHDPQNQRGLKLEEATKTFDVIAAQFLSWQETRLRPSSYAATRYYLLTVFKPLHGMPLASVDGDVVADNLARIAEEDGPVAADRARANLSKFFSWAIGARKAKINPVIGTNKASDPESTRRERVLSDHELRVIWNVLGEGHFADIARLTNSDSPTAQRNIKPAMVRDRHGKGADKPSRLTHQEQART